MTDPNSGQKRLVIVGATGMVGGHAFRYALEHHAVTSLTAIVRRKLGIPHPKLSEVFRNPRGCPQARVFSEVLRELRPRRVLNQHDQDLEGRFLKPYPKAVLVQFAGPKIHEDCPLYLLYLVACKSATPRRHGI